MPFRKENQKVLFNSVKYAPALDAGITALCLWKPPSWSFMEAQRCQKHVIRPQIYSWRKVFCLIRITWLSSDIQLSKVLKEPAFSKGLDWPSGRRAPLPQGCHVLRRQISLAVSFSLAQKAEMNCVVQDALLGTLPPRVRCALPNKKTNCYSAIRP